MSHEPTLPDAVVRQAKAASDIQAMIMGQNPPAADPNNPGNTPPASAAPAPPVAPLPAVLSPLRNHSPVPIPAPVTAEPPVVIQPGVEIPGTCPNCEKQEQRYKVLQGKYDKEVPRLTYRVAYLENINQDLTKENAALTAAAQAAPAAAPVTTPPPGAPAATSIAAALKTSQDEKVKTFRDNFPDVFEFVVDAVDKVAQATKEEAEKRIANVEKDALAKKQDSFLARLAETHPDWQTVCQADPNWPQWLMRKDRYSSSSEVGLA